MEKNTGLHMINLNITILCEVCYENYAVNTMRIDDTDTMSIFLYTKLLLSRTWKLNSKNIATCRKCDVFVNQNTVTHGVNAL